MADSDKNMDIRVLKSTKISVFVDEALQDILVVTYEYGVQIFKGVLLDSTKRNLPCGVETINPAFNVKTNPADDDTLYSVNQRFAYTNPDNAKKKTVNISNNKQKNNKMTVRLRPRQVLCSKCKGICNENSENVGRKRKISDSVSMPSKRSANAPVTRSSNIDAINRRKLNNEMNDFDQLSGDISTALSGNINKLNIDNNSKKPLLTVSNLNTTLKTNKKKLEMHSNEHSDCNDDTTENVEKDVKQTKTANSTKNKKVLRKKKSGDPCEEMWDDNCEENINNKNNTSETSNCSSTRTIKISYGPQGEGTVLKIPAQIESLNMVDESEENVDSENSKLKSKLTNTKAARKALKKAKKEARRKFLLNNSPSYAGNNSPRYSLSGSSPRYMVDSVSTTRHGLGNNSPRYVSANNALELNVPRRRRHKMKHKKKHREDRKHNKEDDTNPQSLEEAAREQCITQKLSINLKRLNKTYTSSQTNDVNKSEESSSDDQNKEVVPDFASPNPPPMMLRMNAKTVSSTLGADGERLLVGDVVWGKMPGFSWWPAKIITIINSENDMIKVHVTWYGTTNSSLMTCDQVCPYIENFKMHYNKNKRGPYKEAVRKAMTEARENAENRLRDTVVGSPIRTLMTVVPPALASPREIDVVS